MSDRSPTPRPSWRSAALGAVGGLMVLLPLGEVIRHQTQDLQLMAHERALLDPLSQAVAVQRGLLSHSDLCQRLLAGRLQLEPERKLRQSVVDTALWDLKGTLSAGLWVKALGEAGQLTLDWRDLTHRIQSRSVDGKTSQADHRLLIEQTLQVMDLVSAAAPPATTPHLLALRHALARGTPGEHEGTRAQALALAVMQDHLQAHSNALDERLSRLKTQRAWVGTAAAGLCLLLAAALLRRRTQDAPPPPPAAHDGVRLGQGRRATDADRVPDATSRLMWHLRQGPSRPATAYSDTLPPAP
jgi:hypothetical protein